jgi:hypothetical protein
LNSLSKELPELTEITRSFTEIHSELFEKYSS